MIPFSCFEPHTGQNHADTIQDIIANWDLKSKDLVSKTKDNGFSFMLAFQMFNLLIRPQSQSSNNQGPKHLIPQLSGTPSKKLSAEPRH